MKKYIYLMLSVVLASLLGACSKDDPFGTGDNTATGALSTAALKVALVENAAPRSLKARNVRGVAPSVEDFTVRIFKENGEEPVESFKYKDMPEIITLPVGDYKVTASYGDNPVAAWESPYYEGTGEFTIEKDEITEEVTEILCKIVNVRISIILEESLREVVSADSKVTVKVGQDGTLDFTLPRIEAGESGYFRYDEGSHTLAATFNGIVDGAPAMETKTGIDVEPGKHYILTFRLHDASEDGPGSIVGSQDGLIIVDATVSTESISGNVDYEEETKEDNLRPSEGPTGGETPEQPDQPSQPDDPSKQAPTVTAQAPVVLGEPYDIGKDPDVALVIMAHSDADGGFTQFTLDMTIEGADLEEVGLSSHMDLSNPTDRKTIEDIIQSVTQQKPDLEVIGKKDFKLDISAFIALLTVFEGNHSFKVTVSDANGTTVKTLMLKV